VSWPDMMTPWDAGHAAPDPLRVQILGGLAYSVIDIRERLAGATAGGCADCGGELCAEHVGAALLADGFENAYMQVASGTAEWCDLAVKLISEMN
jgi:hypothetical protein